VPSGATACCSGRCRRAGKAGWFLKLNPPECQRNRLFAANTPISMLRIDSPIKRPTSCGYILGPPPRRIVRAAQDSTATRLSALRSSASVRHPSRLALHSRYDALDGFKTPRHGGPLPPPPLPPSQCEPEPPAHQKTNVSRLAPATFVPHWACAAPNYSTMAADHALC
jgi:hypothetical protein